MLSNSNTFTSRCDDSIAHSNTQGSRRMNVGDLINKLEMYNQNLQIVISKETTDDIEKFTLEKVTAINGVEKRIILEMGLEV